MKRLKIDPDIQIAVADEFCKAIDEGGDLFKLTGWSLEEMERRQKARNSKVAVNK
jgi:hypothetical protein